MLLAKKNRLLRLAILVLGVCFILVALRAHYLRQANAVRVTTQVIAPASGLVINDTHGTAPGNPQNGVEGLRKFMVIINSYRHSHGGNFPPDETALILDTMRHPPAYGFSDPKQCFALLGNPDVKFSDFQSIRTAPLSIPYNYSGKRLDGSRIGTSKTPGTRDVLAWTSLYFHENKTIFANKPASVHPVGEYLVLWDDGSVEQIPWQNALKVPVFDPFESATRAHYQLPPTTSMRAFRTGFVGEAGLPAGSLTMKNYYSKALNIYLQ